MKNTDLCIIGGGSAGLSLAAGAAQLGVDVTLIEKGTMGGDCLNTGCVPSKALLAAAKRAYHAQHSEAFGLTAQVKIDYAAIRNYVQNVISTIAPHDSVERFESLGVKVIQDKAEFISPTEVKAGYHTIQAKYFVIAAGSHPFIPPIPGLLGTPFLTNETIFTHPTLPQSMLVMGGGPIGLEMAQAFNRLGTQVTVVEGLNILGRDDPETVGQLKKILETEGIKLLEGHLVERVTHSDKGFILDCLTAQGVIKLSGEQLLVAVGRKPNLENLGLEKASIIYTPRGIEVDKALRTNHKHIYAIGDINGKIAFTHAGNLQAGIVLQRLCFKLPVTFNIHDIPWVTYTDPELAQAGLSEAELKAQGIDYEVLQIPLNTNDRALCEGETNGVTKVLISKGNVKGVTLLAPQASDLLPLWLPMLNGKLSLADVSRLTFPYPSRGEWLKKTASTYYSPRFFSTATKSLVKFLMKF